MTEHLYFFTVYFQEVFEQQKRSIEFFVISSDPPPAFLFFYFVVVVLSFGRCVAFDEVHPLPEVTQKWYYLGQYLLDQRTVLDYK